MRVYDRSASQLAYNAVIFIMRAVKNRLDGKKAVQKGYSTPLVFTSLYNTTRKLFQNAIKVLPQEGELSKVDKKKAPLESVE